MQNQENARRGFRRLGMRPERALAALFLACVLSSCSSVARAVQPAPAAAAVADSSRHLVRFVEVEPGVKLEVLDWGGTGEPMVLLGGLGDNAHVYDNFAYQFTDRFHVYAITRRGFGRSSQPATGYDVASRALDDVKVLDSLSLGSAVFVGHSMAGDELSELGANHPARVSKLVYLDALDYGVHGTLAQPPVPEYTDRDLESLQQFAAAYARYFGSREPDAAFSGTYVLDAAGHVVAPGLSPPEITQKMVRGSKQAEYSKITAPTLAILVPLAAGAAFFPLFNPSSARRV